VRPDSVWSLGPRAYEIAACGGFQIAQAGRGELEEVFGDTVPVFETAQGMQALATFYVEHDKERQRLARLQNERVLPCSFDNRAQEIVLPKLAAIASPLARQTGRC